MENLASHAQDKKVQEYLIMSNVLSLVMCLSVTILLSLSHTILFNSFEGLKIENIENFSYSLSGTFALLLMFVSLIGILFFGLSEEKFKLYFHRYSTSIGGYIFLYGTSLLLPQLFRNYAMQDLSNYLSLFMLLTVFSIILRNEINALLRNYAMSKSFSSGGTLREAVNVNRNDLSIQSTSKITQYSHGVSRERLYLSVWVPYSLVPIKSLYKVVEKDNEFYWLRSDGLDEVSIILAIKEFMERKKG
ncbi:MAG: hypothetical protein LBV67_09635 [Streptococcaceae bacterium]|jgi:uncharacterized MnhB-related membrane protein|nr:hypothetical protein [Streptococcaceae bacterium]